MLCNLGYCYLKNNEPEEALKVFHSVAEATFSYTIGLAYSHFKGLSLNVTTFYISGRYLGDVGTQLASRIIAIMGAIARCLKRRIATELK